MSEAVDQPGTLTEAEARERAALLQVERYDITIDLRGLLDGEVWAATSATTFTCRRPGATSFAECRAEVMSAVLNGVEVDPEDISEHRIVLRDLQAENVLVVTGVQRDTTSGQAIQRTVDPTDDEVYVWTSFEPDGAQRAWACFDQPDLKAPHRFVVDAPGRWSVLSNGAPEEVHELDGDDGLGRRWLFPDTPPLSTYVVVVNAGPFHEVREERGGHSLGLWCRRSLQRYLERDAAEWFEVTEQGLAFFTEQFGQPFPQERYDQVFVPDMGGAMENWGCVTWTDAVLFRSEPTYDERASVATVLLHEMAHMWFGDLVTMRWWDDLWLNEAFASWAASWAAARATRYTDVWATHALSGAPRGYAMDAGPARHPIRGEVPDVAQAMANFDAITYVKGMAVLRQLAATVGEDAFVAGLRSYFAAHAWGSTVLDDLVRAVGTAAGRDLSGWRDDWLDRAGTDTLSLLETTLLCVAPDRPRPRPHRLDIGCYLLDGDDLRLVERLDVRTTGPTTPLKDRLPDADLYLLNESDLTFAAVRTDETSLEVMLTSAATLPEPLSRAVVVATAWDMLTKGELSTSEFLDATLRVLEREASPGLVEPLFGLALEAASAWTPGPLVPARLARVAAVAEQRVVDPTHRLVALRALAASAGTDDQLALVTEAGGDDVDLAWRSLVRRAVLGRHDADAVARLLERDPDPDARVRALGVTAARADDDAKHEVWTAVFEQRAVPSGQPMRELATCFWQPTQDDLLEPWTHRYLDEVARLDDGGLLAGAGLMRAMMPVVADETFVDRARSIATAPQANPTLRTTLLSGADRLARSLRARN